MIRPKFPLFGPLAGSRKRQSTLEDQLRQLDAKTNPEEHARITGLIQLEEDFRASFSGFLKEQKAQRRSVSAKGILQMVALSILIFIAIGLKRHFLVKPPNSLFGMATQQQCVARRMDEPTLCGALLLRTGQLQP